MSVIVKGMDMPMCCDECPMLYEYRFCALTDDHAKSIGWKTEEKRMPNCPLIELPDHGDLVEKETAAAILKLAFPAADYDGLCRATQALQWLSDAPVVIPAERSEDA